MIDEFTKRKIIKTIDQVVNSPDYLSICEDVDRNQKEFNKYIGHCFNDEQHIIRACQYIEMIISNITILDIIDDQIDIQQYINKISIGIFHAGKYMFKKECEHKYDTSYNKIYTLDRGGKKCNVAEIRSLYQYWIKGIAKTTKDIIKTCKKNNFNKLYELRADLYAFSTEALALCNLCTK